MKRMNHPGRSITVGNIPILSFANRLSRINSLHGKLFTVNRDTFIHSLHHHMANWQRRINCRCLHRKELVRQLRVIRLESMNPKLQQRHIIGVKRDHIAFMTLTKIDNDFCPFSTRQHQMRQGHRFRQQRTITADLGKRQIIGKMQPPLPAISAI